MSQQFIGKSPRVECMHLCGSHASSDVTRLSALVPCVRLGDIMWSEGCLSLQMGSVW